ncbi:MAG: preprotein translocase subunit YajC [Kiritimatiellae bacterium]|nr:preprotein translocase subunit YajC [Kiritimatiellia bacterium]
MNETPATVETVAAEGTAAPAAPGAQNPQQPSSLGMFVPMLLILAIFYFMMIRPQQRKEKERRKMIDELRAGAKIVFAGGIFGTIVEATEKTFKVETAPGVTMEILRSAVQGTANVASEG